MVYVTKSALEEFIKTHKITEEQYNQLVKDGLVRGTKLSESERELIDLHLTALENRDYWQNRAEDAEELLQALYVDVTSCGHYQKLLDRVRDYLEGK